jgi:hypothetical protein
VFDKVEGAYCYDVDGNKYIDYVGSVRTQTFLLFLLFLPSFLDFSLSHTLNFRISNPALPLPISGNYTTTTTTTITNPFQGPPTLCARHQTLD